MQSAHYTTDQIHQLPQSPGVYRYYGKNQKIIYVGKAKNLRKRVQSYFVSKAHNLKTVKMVREIDSIEITIVDSEMDALLLENNLIKQLQPKYNILLKDDKSYPYILVTNDPFPKIFSTRNVDKQRGMYYGPYTNHTVLRSLLELFRELYHIRTCKLNLNDRDIASGKFEVCLEYHIGKCLAPCVGKISREEYLQEVQQCEHILKGKLGLAKNYFKEKMMEEAGRLAFEKAEEYKQKLLSLEQFQSKTIIINPSLPQMDVIGIVSDEERAFVNFLSLENGAIKSTKTIEVQKKLEETEEEIAPLLLVSLQEKFKSKSLHILSNVEIEDFGDYTFSVPKIGDKKKLVELAIKNALHFKKERLAQKEKSSQRSENTRLLKTVAKELHLTAPPKHIECFDNSNIQGTNPVASMVCFRNGKPSKKDYRKFIIKTVEGPDDFRSMYEVVHRRYKRLLDESKELPDLVVIDGGKGQLSFAVQALQDLGIYNRLAIIGIAKKLEELYYPGDSLPLHLDRRSETLRMLQHLRNEAHRFAITFHRDRRSKNAFQFELEEVKGIGKSTVKKLLEHFKTPSSIRNASDTKLQKLIGKAKAKILIDYYEKKSSE